jgi:hypothetical protein
LPVPARQAVQAVFSVFMPPRFRNKRDSFYRTALWRRDLAQLFNESRKAPFSWRGLDATPRAVR